MMFSRNSSGLAPHRLAQAVVERREPLDIRAHHVDILELQPLAGEILHQRGGLSGRAASASPGRSAPRAAADAPGRRRAAVPRPACCSTGNRKGATPARSRSLATRCVRAPPAGSRSMRYRKFGETRTACSAVAIPSSNESPCLRARVDVSQVLFALRRRPPDGGTRASVKLVKIVRAHASVCFPGAWPQTKILRRLSGEGPVA